MAFSPRLLTPYEPYRNAVKTLPATHFQGLLPAKVEESVCWRCPGLLAPTSVGPPSLPTLQRKTAHQC